jgi:hypothetical protein
LTQFLIQTTTDRPAKARVQTFLEELCWKLTDAQAAAQFSRRVQRYFCGDSKLLFNIYTQLGILSGEYQIKAS